MESHIQSQEDHLIEGLSFKLKPGASYVTNRDSVSYFPSGGNQYTPTGVKVIKIVLSGDNWLDPSTCKIMFHLIIETVRMLLNLLPGRGDFAGAIVS